VTAQIPRSTGALHGPASSPRQVRQVILRVEEPQPGMLRLTTLTASGWSVAVRTPHELARAIALAFTEAQVAAYSRWRGHEYDAEEMIRRPSKPRRRSTERCDVYDPREWRLTSDGRWRAPGGNVYREETATVQSVMQRRMRLGLTARPDPVDKRGLLGGEVGST
jgi:hypothetical protein